MSRVVFPRVRSGWKVKQESSKVLAIIFRCFPLNMFAYSVCFQLLVAVVNCKCTVKGEAE